MPAKAHRPSGPNRSHSRTSSGGSSKLGLNLQITQKEPPPPRVADKTKKSAHFHHEPNARAASAQFMRSNSGIRVHSRENLQPAAIRRAPTPTAAAKQNGARQKVDFSISSPDEGEDDDDWVSSESGAATPDNESDTDSTPIEQAKPRAAAQPAPVQSAQQTQVNATLGHDVATPKAVPPSLPRVDTARPSQLPLVPTARDFALHEQKLLHPESSPRPSDQQRPKVEIQISTPTPPVSKARSETHSPPRRSPDIDPSYKRQSMTRPPSTHSVTSPTLRPHPLIRGHSYAHGLAAKPAPLSPVATVLPDAASGQMSTASSSPTSHRAGSPTSIRTVSASPSLSSPSSSSPAHRQLRRTSTSSVASNATMPVLPSASEKLSSRSNHDRHRTLSTISSSSSIAALTNFALRSTPSPSRTPITFTSHFPPQEQSAASEVIHPLLPPPYLSAHLTVLAYRNPIAESYDRVIRAKERR
ncbi:hypothetical protein K466DRAFT_476026 [Polyporus arcularius HHB13444]|uniref:Uncharacterized protein n=1 Tax=Polyporus arcularius HHB13444 TaxID=1314778 RepID=A0A5C3PYA6_9APHY|nr:hypothetical protein K466DRAFT_476026 [Polyporus arcularius HHB13444]